MLLVCALAALISILIATMFVLADDIQAFRASANDRSDEHSYGDWPAVPSLHSSDLADERQRNHG
jgi:hypothetical protein